MNNEREEQMMAEAEKYGLSVMDDFYVDLELTKAINDFCAGWRAADSKPNWIPVEKELPKVSGDYIIREKRGFVKEAHYFELDDLWMLHGGALVSPTHWMPIPQLPRKEER